MLILALDCCGSSCAVGVWRDGEIIAATCETMPRGQDARLMPMIVEVMTAARCDFFALDKIAVTRGPGSFTGTRVGLAAARGIGLAAHKPVIGIDRFAIYHAVYRDHDANILVVLESKRAELFCRYFPASGAAAPAALMNENQIAAFVKAHPDTKTIGDRADDTVDSIKICADLAANADPANPNYQPRPLYLRAPDVTLPTDSKKAQAIETQ